MASLTGGGLPSTPQQDQDPTTASWKKFSETNAEIAEEDLKADITKGIKDKADATTYFAKAAQKGKDSMAPYDETLHRDGG